MKFLRVRRWIWEFWLLRGLVEYFEDQLENFKNIEDHFVILRGSEDQNVILQNWGTRLDFSVDRDFHGFGVRSSTEIRFSS